jgi:hypothetical protein
LFFYIDIERERERERERGEREKRGERGEERREREREREREEEEERKEERDHGLEIRSGIDTIIIYYEGESNAGNPVSYSRCFPELINQWRNDWKSQSLSDQLDIPFFFVQISSWYLSI